MDKKLAILMEKGLGNIADRSIQKLVDDSEDMIEIQKKLAQNECQFIALKIDDMSHKIVDEYVNSLEDYQAKYSDLAYLAGVRDAILLLSTLKMLKDE